MGTGSSCTTKVYRGCWVSIALGTLIPVVVLLSNLLLIGAETAIVGLTILSATAYAYALCFRIRSGVRHSEILSKTTKDLLVLAPCWLLATLCMAVLLQAFMS